LLKFYSILSYPAQILFNPARSAINCDNYERKNVMISIIMMFQCFKLHNFKKIYSKWNIQTT